MATLRLRDEIRKALARCESGCMERGVLSVLGEYGDCAVVEGLADARTDRADPSRPLCLYVGDTRIAVFGDHVKFLVPPVNAERLTSEKQKDSMDDPRKCPVCDDGEYVDELDNQPCPECGRPFPFAAALKHKDARIAELESGRRRIRGLLSRACESLERHDYGMAAALCSEALDKEAEPCE